jgi:putative hydrolase of the HAD superfamily
MTKKPPDELGSPPRFEAILFDLFGTLIPTGDRASRVRHLTEMAEVLDVEPAAFAAQWLDTFDERARGTFGNIEETIYRLAGALGRNPSREEVHRAANIRLRFSRELLDSCGPILPEIDALRSAGFRMAIVSDASEETPRLWATSPLASRMDVTVFSCQEGVRKPHSQIYQLALARLGLGAYSCAFVGDGGSHELVGAEAVGLSAFLYRFPGENEDSAYRVDAETGWAGAKLASLGELLRYHPSREVNPAST